MSGTAWEDALDQLEELLRRQEAALVARAAPPPAPLPEVDGPLPAALRARAEALLERCCRLEDRTAGALDDHRRRLPAFATGAARGTDLGTL